MLDPGIEHTPRIREADAAAAALEELHAQSRLQPLHLAGERRLREVQPLCGMADVAFLYNSVKSTHIFYFHGLILFFHPLRSNALL